MLTRWLTDLAGGVRTAAGESVLLGWLFPGERSASAPGTGSYAHLHFRMMRLQEESLWRRTLMRLWEWLLHTSVGAFGRFQLMGAAVSLALYFADGGNDFLSVRVLLSAAYLLSSLPLLGVPDALSLCLRQGRLTGGFLVGFCGLSPERLGDRERGRERRFFPLFAGAVCGVLAAFLPAGALSLAGLFLTVFFLFHAVPELSVLGVLLAFPFLPLLPHATLALAGMTLLSFAVYAGKWLSGRRDLPMGRLGWTVVAFAGVYLLAGGAEGAVCALLILGGWFPVRSLGEVWRRRAVGCLTASASLCAGLGIFEYFSGRAALKWVDLSRFSDIGGRVCVFFGNPNILAVFLLAAFPFALYGTMRFRSPAGRTGAGIGALLIALCTLLTWSRGGWLGMLAETFLFLAVSGRESLALLFTLPLPAAALTAFLPHSVTNRFSSIGNLAESSVRYRLEVWRGVARMIGENPFGIGVGEAQFRRVYRLFAIPGTETVMHAHEIFLQVASETGLAGAAVFLLLLVRILRSFRPRGEAIAAFPAVLGLLVMGCFDHLWYARGMLWLLFAVSALVPTGKSGKTEDVYAETAEYT